MYGLHTLGGSKGILQHAIMQLAEETAAGLGESAMTTEWHVFGPSERLCEACGSSSLEEFVVAGTMTMWHCPRCNLYQKGRVAEADDYDAAYHALHYGAHRSHKVKTAAARLSRVAALVAAPQPKLLDVGCSLGCTVEAAVRRGWDAHGADVSRDAVDYCRSRKLNCRLIGSPELPYEDETFDVLTAWHVIEHVADVRQTLAEWRRVLKPEGLMVLETPDGACLKVKLRRAGYRRFWKAEHVYTFDRGNLTPLVEAAGFEIMPPPFWGRLASLPPGLAAYAISHRSHQAIMSLARLTKAFELFCRRTPAGPISLPLPSTGDVQTPLRRAA